MSGEEFGMELLVTVNDVLTVYAPKDPYIRKLAAQAAEIAELRKLLGRVTTEAAWLYCHPGGVTEDNAGDYESAYNVIREARRVLGTPGSDSSLKSARESAEVGTRRTQSETGPGIETGKTQRSGSSRSSASNRADISCCTYCGHYIKEVHDDKGCRWCRLEAEHKVDEMPADNPPSKERA